MIRAIILCLLVLSLSNAQSQQLVDIAISQGMTTFQNFTNGLSDGMSFYDFDEDGWDDITYPMHNDSIIFYKNTGGDFLRIGSFLRAEGAVREILWVDYDNDNDLDLCVSYINLGIRLYQNDGNFNFIDVSLGAGLLPSVENPYGFSFADSDNDSDLDLYVCNYLLPIAGSTTNKYYQNQGNGTFVEMASALGISNNVAATFMATWFDYNNDQLIDLHVINDRELTEDALYTNQGMGFTDDALALGVLNEAQNPMTSSIADYDNDGFQDIFVTDVGDGFSYLGDPFSNKLFKNNGGAGFTNLAPTYNLTTNATCWGALWVDYNNDSYEDLYVATGELSGFNTYPSMFFRNEAGAGFTLITDSIQGNITMTSFSPVKGDIDNDGFYDIAIINKNTPVTLLLNGGNDNNYLKITPVGIVSNRMAIGSQIRVYSEGIQQLQTVFCGEGICSQNSQHKIFGVGSAQIVDSVIITFPSGLIAKRYNIPVNQSIQILEEEIVLVEVQLNILDSSIVLCEGDTLLLQATGMNIFGWNNGASDSILVITQPGTYYFEAENSNGDTIYRSVELIVISETYPIHSHVSVSDGCDTIGTGSVELFFFNEQDISAVVWSTGDTGFYVSNLNTGVYQYSFTTTNNCTYDGQVFVGGLEEIFPQIMTDPVTDSTLGGITIYVFGGVPPYTYFLDGDSVGSTILNLQSGWYNVVVMDSLGCSSTQQVYIPEHTTTGLSDKDLDLTILLGNETLTIDVGEFEVQTVQVISVNGAILLNDLNVYQSNLVYPFSYPAGAYFIVVETNNGIQRRLLYQN